MDNFITIMSDPETWVIIMLLAKIFAPAWVPFLGVGKKVTEELIELHNQNSIPNDTIKENAEKLGLTEAGKVLEQKLK